MKTFSIVKRCNAIVCLFALLPLVSCITTPNSKGNNVDEKDSLMKENQYTPLQQTVIKRFEAHNKELPMEQPDKGGTLLSVKAKGNRFVYTVSISPEFLKNAHLDYIADTDSNAVAILRGFSESNINLFKEIDMGLKYVYVNEINDSVLSTIDLSPDRMVDLWNKIKSGQMKAFTVYDIIKKDLASTPTPYTIEEGVVLIEAYLEGNKVYQVIQFQIDFDEAFFLTQKSAMKAQYMETLRKLILPNKEEYLKEDIRYIYIHKNKKGDVLNTIEIPMEECFR